ncbi:MAG: hypothetical protein COB67_08625 [SAR324 cluster bacterium]|uniref:Polysaccharide biosynthesis protein n=1 Tax=SAR324 cluster bacterium TaxID=2024889 RepID=A0A2A4T144_9DELT|nr:MAG: hypothetical protein COB67_08625 [SAR324 cluster bacterium]
MWNMILQSFVVQFFSARFLKNNLLFTLCLIVFANTEIEVKAREVNASSYPLGAVKLNRSSMSQEQLRKINELASKLKKTPKLIAKSVDKNTLESLMKSFQGVEQERKESSVKMEPDEIKKEGPYEKVKDLREDELKVEAEEHKVEAEGVEDVEGKVEAENLEKLEELNDEKTSTRLKLFGYNYFAPARKRLLELERKIINNEELHINTGGLVNGFIGPMEMISSSVFSTIPQTYQLAPGDLLKIAYWGITTAYIELELEIDGQGFIKIPSLGKIVVKGVTLSQFQENLTKILKRKLGRSLQLTVSLSKLRSMQVFIAGEAFRQGTYMLNSSTTLFNALYAAGGITNNGSLRDIRLLRDQAIIRVDFYDYLLKGSHYSDLPLQEGDTIFIPLVKKTVSISGEVFRPAIYELKVGEKLKDLFAMAGGIKSTGIYENVQLSTLKENQERILLDLDLTKDEKLFDTELFHEDTVTVQALFAGIIQTVVLKGAVERPGTYGFKEGMRLSDLFSSVNKPFPDVYLERAEIIRKIVDAEGTQLLPLNLGKALAGDEEHDLELVKQDQVMIYRKSEIEFTPLKTIHIVGLVQRPGAYQRSENMNVMDLLMQAGGVLPHSYLQRADLLRYDFQQDITRIIPVRLDLVLEGDSEANLQLQDKDLLRVYSKKEIRFTPKHQVSIVGAVQRPRTYLRSENMTIKDLLVQSGGLLPNSYLQRADLLRYDFLREMTTLIPVDLKRLLKGDTAENYLLKDRDLLRIYSSSEVKFTKPHKVSIFGAVQRPMEYIRSDGMRLKTLIFKAGGPLPGFYKIIEVVRAGVGEELGIFQIDLEQLQAGDESQNILLQDEDIVMVKSKGAFITKPLLVTIEGEVRYPGVYALRSREERITDVLKRAGGLTIWAYPKGTIFKRRQEWTSSDEIIKDLKLVNTSFDLSNILEYQRLRARNEYLLLLAQKKDAVGQVKLAPIITSDASKEDLAKSSMAPGIVESAGKSIESAFEAFQDQPAVTSKARLLGQQELQPSERIIINMKSLLTTPGERADLVLLDGDSIRVPRAPSTISVIGAVIRPTLISVQRNEEMDQYIKLAGGFTSDANIEKTLIFRVDGSLIPVEELEQIEVGDVIYVPTKPQSEEIITTTDKILETIKFTLITIVSYMALLAVIGL